MGSRITVAVARTSCQQFASSPANFLGEINLVNQKLMGAEIWNGLLQAVDFKNGTGTGIITLPPQFASVVGWQLFGVAEAIFDDLREWQEGGFGFFDEEKYKTDSLYELPAGSVAQNDIQSIGYLALYPNNPLDAGKTVRLFGLDQNDDVIYDPNGNLGISLTSAFPSSQTGTLFSKLTGIQLPGFLGGCNLYVKDFVTNALSLLSYYDPGTTIPFFKRYKVGIWTPQQGQPPNIVPIRCYCRRQFVPAVAETDYIWPDNLNAIELGLQGLKERRALNFVGSRAYFGDAERELDKDIEQYRGAAETTLRLRGWNLPKAASFYRWPVN